MRRRQLLLTAGAALVAACAPSGPGGTTSGGTSSAAANGRPNDPNAGNPAAGVWPTFMVAMSAPVKDAYLYAATHPEVLQYIPCYCGCGTPSHNGGHSDNERCYVVSRQSNGWMILEPHGSQCGTCVGITQDTKSLLSRGMTLKEVRAEIDKKWSTAGPPTPTKLPPS